MDLSPSTICSCPSGATQITVLFLFVYPFVIWAMSRSRREGIGPMSASAIPVSLTPLFIGSAASFLDLVNAIRGMALSGGGRRAISAGLAESFGPMLFASCVTAIVTTILWGRDQFRRKGTDAARPSTSRSVATTGAVMVVILIGLLIVHVFIARTIGDTLEQIPLLHQVSLIGAILSAVGGLTSFVWLVASRRRPGAQINTARVGIAAACAAAGGVLACSYWYLTGIYTSIAMHG